MRHFLLTCLAIFASCCGLLESSSAQDDQFIIASPELEPTTGRSELSKLIDDRTFSESITESVGQTELNLDSESPSFEVAQMAKDLNRDRARYFAIAGGINWLDDATTTGNVFSASIGTSLRHRMRIGVEYVRRSNKDEYNYSFPTFDSEVTLGAYSNAFLANVFYDLEGPKLITFYSGAGIGASIMTVETNIDETHYGPWRSTGFHGRLTRDEARREIAFGASETVFAYQFTTGASAPMSPATELFVEYRFFGTTDVEFNHQSLGSYYAHNALIGLRVNF